MLSAGFNIGRSNLTEAAISGVNFANWGSFAHRLRRETAVGPADPEGNGSGHCPPGFRIGGSKAKEAASSGVHYAAGGELRQPSPEENASGGSPRRFVADERNMGAAFRQQCAFRREIRDFVAVYGISSRNTAFRRIILLFKQYYAIIDSYASPCVNIIL